TPARQRGVRELAYILQDRGFDLLQSAISRHRLILDTQESEGPRLIDGIAVLQVERKRLEVARLHDVGRDLEAGRRILARPRDKRILEARDHREFRVIGAK